MSKVLSKYIAAYRSGCLGDNILASYFPLFANIICEEGWHIIGANDVASKFEEKYQIKLPLQFVRQVLSIGVTNGSIIEDHGVYSTQNGIISQYLFNDKTFDDQWSHLVKQFRRYCDEIVLDLTNVDIETRILECINDSDEKIVQNEEVVISDTSDTLDYAWYQFLRVCSNKDKQLFDFVASLSLSNILQQALFYSGNGQESYKDLNVYLDSPIVFALIGMDLPARCESCKMLVEEMQKAGCNVQIFDHNFQEIKGILTGASGWAISADYDISKASNAARYFHDNLMSITEISEFCVTLEGRLNGLGISIRQVDYDPSTQQFQEDEKKLFSMVEEKYRDNNRKITLETRSSITIDIRSIIMIYRLRQGQTSTTIQSSKHILITLNNAVAYVAKQYESNCSLNAGHIPTCVYSDFFGAVLWLFSPVSILEYQRKTLLADCYTSLKPSKEMIKRYVDSLNLAKNAGEIDEKTFLFLRSHSAVYESLMNITKGDYARFNERTYREVYEEIVEKAEKKYSDEAEQHKSTQRELDDEREKHQILMQEFESFKHEQTLTNEASRKLIQELQDYQKAIRIKRAERKGLIVTSLLFGIPYIIILSITDIFKSRFSDFSLLSIVSVCVLVLVPILAFLFYKKVQHYFVRLFQKQIGK